MKKNRLCLSKQKLVCCLMLPLSLNAVLEARSIQFSANPARWTISTRHSSCQIILTKDKNLTPGFYGPIAGPRLYEAPNTTASVEQGTILREIPYRGGFQAMEPMLEVIFADHTREVELIYQGHEIREVDGYPCLRLDMRDSHYPFSVSEYIRVLPELDMLEKWVVLKNTGRDTILIERAYSGSILLPKGAYDFIQLSGEWGRECVPRQSLLTSGTKTIAVKGVRSHQHAAFFAVRPAGETEEFSGSVWFGSLVWGGNWAITANVSRMERTQITAGINHWDTHWNLQAGQTYETPKMIAGFSADGMAGASHRLHRYTLDHLLPAPFNTRESQVLYNSWYATTFNVTETDQVTLARIAKEIGVELFVIDDGWFKGRINDHAGLGDWTPDKNKFPNGLGPMIEKINDLDMDFGIWVEPEMVNPDSDLYRAYPDWVLQVPHHTLHTQRWQVILNFAREDVKEHTLAWLGRLLSENNIAFVKWDMNRYIAESGWPDADPQIQRELRIRYMRNLYDVLQTLRKNHPQVVIETCSGGGGRSNYGMLQYTDQIWTSDNTLVGDRLQIQHGFSHAFPAKVMVNWITDESWYGEKPSLRFRFLVSMAGNLGIGSNLHKWTKDDIATAKMMIALYKEIRPVVQLGDQYRLWNPFKSDRSAVQFVTRDGRESVVFAYRMSNSVRSVNKENNRLVLHGLNADTQYRLFGDIPEQRVTGAVLMSSGISVDLRRQWDGRLIRIMQVE